MIGVYFKGRLGNQMFQYVFFKYLQSVSKNKIVFFTNPHHAYLAEYFELERFQRITFQSKVYSLIARFIPVIFRFKNVYLQNFVRPREIRPQNFTVYHGYFQSDWYLNQLPHKPQFNIKPKYVKAFMDLYGDIFKNEKTVVVYIRRTDYLTYGKRDITLPLSYFKKRMEEIEDLDSYRVFFVSDDIPFVRAVFEDKPNYVFSGKDEIIDFQIIQNADIAIISNSSFSWWAAYLSKKQNIVYAPKNWIGYKIGVEHPKGIMTSKFIWKNVY